MSGSSRTEPKWLQAASRVPFDRRGRAIMPRLVEHPARPGDVHLLDRRSLSRLLPRLRLEFIHGLRAIELRARVGEVGDPYAYYDGRHKIIRLFSVPYPDWPWPSRRLRSGSSLDACGAVLVTHGAECVLHWSSRKDAARFFFSFVLAHELGHHHAYQYKHKRRLPGSPRAHEDRAEAVVMRMRAWTIFNGVFGSDDA